MKKYKVRIKSMPSTNVMAYGGQNSRGGLDLGGRVYDGTEQDPYKTSNTLNSVPRSEANIEAEKGETAYGDFNQDGKLEHMNIGGKRHTHGGTPLNVPDGTFIYSDTAKMKIGGPVLESFGKTAKNKKKYTPAELAKQYNINKYQAIIDNPKSDELAKRTARIMITNYERKLAELALVQEGMKGFPSGIPKIAEGLVNEMIPAQAPQTKEAMMAAEEEQMRYGGHYLPKAQTGLNKGQVDEATGYWNRVTRGNLFQRENDEDIDPRMREALQKVNPFSSKLTGVGDYFSNLLTIPQKEANHLMTGFYESPMATVGRYDNVSGSQQFVGDVLTDPMIYPELPYMLGKQAVKGALKFTPYGVMAGKYLGKQAKKAYDATAKLINKIPKGTLINTATKIGTRTGQAATHYKDKPVYEYNDQKLVKVNGQDIGIGSRGGKWYVLSTGEPFKGNAGGNATTQQAVAPGAASRNTVTLPGYGSVNNVNNLVFNPVPADFPVPTWGNQTPNVAPAPQRAATPEVKNPAATTTKTSAKKPAATKKQQTNNDQSIFEYGGQYFADGGSYYMQAAGQTETPQPIRVKTNADGSRREVYNDVIKSFDKDGKLTGTVKRDLPKVDSSEPASALIPKYVYFDNAIKKYRVEFPEGTPTEEKEILADYFTKTGFKDVVQSGSGRLADPKLKDKYKYFYAGVTPEDYENKFAKESLGSERAAQLSQAEKRKHMFDSLGIKDISTEMMNNPDALYNDKNFIEKVFHPAVTSLFPEDKYRKLGSKTGVYGLDYLDGMKVNKPAAQPVEQKTPVVTPDVNPNDFTPTANSFDPNIGYFPQDNRNVGRAIFNRARINKYLPYEPAITATVPNPAFMDPTRELAANAEMANMQMQQNAMFTGPQQLAARNNNVMGQSAVNAANIMAKYNSANVGEANRFAGVHADIMNNLMVENARRAKSMYDGTTIANQQYDQSVARADNEIFKTLNNRESNRFRAQLSNMWYPEFAFDPADYSVNFSNSGARRITPGQSNAGKTAIDYFADLKRDTKYANLPDSVLQDEAKRRAGLARVTTTNDGNIRSTSVQQAPYFMNPDYFNFREQ